MSLAIMSVILICNEQIKPTSWNPFSLENRMQRIEKKIDKMKHIEKKIKKMENKEIIKAKNYITSEIPLEDVDAYKDSMLEKLLSLDNEILTSSLIPNELRIAIIDRDIEKIAKLAKKHQSLLEDL